MVTNSFINWFNSLSFLTQLFSAVIILDFITGNLRALYVGDWDSKSGTKGAYKMLAKASVAIAIEWALSASPLQLSELLNMVYVAFVISGLGSIIENIAPLGMPVPKLVAKRFNRLREDVMNGDTDDKDENV